MNLLLTSGEIGGIIGGSVAGVIILIIIIWAIATHNKFVALRNQYEEAFHNIDIYCKKRYDLIPNLVETVKGYTKHESATLEKVIQARSKALTASTTAEKIEANAQLTSVLRGFNRVTERYPELKANTNFLDLQNQLKVIENELANARKYYNATMKVFNTKKDTFPSSIVAKCMHLEKQPYFELESPEERQNVKVQF